jgi:hypothetical protein
LISDFKIVAQADSYKGSKIFEVPTAGNKAIIYCNQQRLLECVVQSSLFFTLRPHFLLVLLVIGGEYVIKSIS